MSVASASNTLRGAPRPSHLRQVSNGSSDTFCTDSSTGTTVQHDPKVAKKSVGRRCMLWVHEESVSKEDVVLNLDLFPDIKAGELMAIVALRTDSGVRDFQDAEPTHKNETNGIGSIMQREGSSTNLGSLVKPNGIDAKHDIDLGKRYLFIARDMGKEMKTKQPGLEVSVAKHIADVFSLKHRSNVLLTTVRLATISHGLC